MLFRRKNDAASASVRNEPGASAISTTRFRRSFSGGKVTMTAGVYALPDMVKAASQRPAKTTRVMTIMLADEY